MKPIKAKLYGTEEGLLRETVKHSVNLDLDNYPRAKLEVPLNLENYNHQGQDFSVRLDGGPPDNLSTYKHNGKPFSVAKSERDKGRFERLKEFISRSDVKINNYLAKDAESALNEIENGAVLFEVRGESSDGSVKSIGEPVRTEIKGRESYLENLEIVEDLVDDDEILTNNLLKSKKSRYLGCSHRAESRIFPSPSRAWRDFQSSSIELAANIDVGLEHPVALGYLGDIYSEEPEFGYRLVDDAGRIPPSEYSKEEITIAREFEEVVERVKSLSK